MELFGQFRMTEYIFVVPYVHEVVTILYSNLLHKMGHNFLDTQYIDGSEFRPFELSAKTATSTVLSQMTDVPDNRRPRWPNLNKLRKFTK